jgi:hypothetical protein
MTTAVSWLTRPSVRHLVIFTPPPGCTAISGLVPSGGGGAVPAFGAAVSEAAAKAQG